LSEADYRHSLPIINRTKTLSFNRRLILFSFALLFAVGAIGVLVLSLQSEPPQPTASQHASVTPTETVQPTTTPVRTKVIQSPSGEIAHTPRATMTQPPQNISLVAEVNAVKIYASDVRLARDINAAMSEFLGRDIDDDNILSELINQQLVLQAATNAGFSLSDAEVDAWLNAFLENQGKSLSALQASLHTHGVSWQAFREHIRQLLIVDRFARQKASALNISVDDYISILQGNARISFGPSAATLAEQPASMPEPTPSSASAAANSPLSTPTATITASERGLLRGQTPPNFTLPLLNGDDLTLDELLGQPIVLSFFTTWCPYCRRQTPVLVNAEQQYGDQIQFIGIDVREGTQVVQSYVETHGIPYPVLLDERGRTARTYGVNGFPTTYFLDAHGRIVAKHIGALTPDTLERYLKQLINHNQN